MANENSLLMVGRKSYIEVSTDGGTNYTRLSGISSIEESGGEATTTNIDLLEESLTTQGNPSNPAVTLTIDTANLIHPGWDDVIRATEDGTELAFRVYYGVQNRRATGSGAATTNTVAHWRSRLLGMLPNAGTNAIDLSESRYAPGLVLKVGPAGTNAANFHKPTQALTMFCVRSLHKLVQRSRSHGAALGRARPGALLYQPQQVSGLCELAQTFREFNATVTSYPTLTVNQNVISGSVGLNMAGTYPRMQITPDARELSNLAAKRYR